jgi:hypothetical protein
MGGISSLLLTNNRIEDPQYVLAGTWSLLAYFKWKYYRFQNQLTMVGADGKQPHVHSIYLISVVTQLRDLYWTHIGNPVCNSKNVWVASEMTISSHNHDETSFLSWFTDEYFRDLI